SRLLTGANELLWHLAVSPLGRGSSRPAGVGWTLGVAGGSEAAVNVVVDHADVLHERVHTRGPDKAVPLRLQLLGERLRLRCRGGEVRERTRRTLGGALVGSRQLRKTRRHGAHRPGVVDGRLDL